MFLLLNCILNMLIIIRTELSNNKIDLYSTIERFHQMVQRGVAGGDSIHSEFSIAQLL